MKQTRNTPSYIFRDLAQIANGAASTLGSLRSEMDVIRAGRSDRQAAASGSVPREDFDAALSRIEALAGRIALLEARLDSFAQAPVKTKSKPARPRESKISKKGKKSLISADSLRMLDFCKTTRECGLDLSRPLHFVLNSSGKFVIFIRIDVPVRSVYDLSAPAHRQSTSKSLK